MQKSFVVGLLVLVLSGCTALMTPEERSAFNTKKAMAMAPVNLCSAILFNNNTPPEAFQVAELKGIDCNSQTMRDLLAMKQQEDRERTARINAAVEKAQIQLQQQQLLYQQNRNTLQALPAYKPPTTCHFMGNTMTCY